jgi:hypothetical protein
VIDQPDRSAASKLHKFRMSDPAKESGKTQSVQLAAVLGSYWPLVFGRLGERAVAYVDAGVQKAAAHQIFDPTGVARFVNLCCAFGPNFEDKSENEWALAVLADERLGEWVKVHQLVVRSVGAFARRSADDQVILKALQQADTALLDAADALQNGSDADSGNLPRVACDIDAFEIRMLDFEWRHQYQNVGGVWQFVAVSGIEASFRLGADRLMPQQISILSRAASSGSSAGVQVRMVMHAHCDQDHHPRLRHIGTHGLSRWNGHLAKSVSWPVDVPAKTATTQAAEITLVEETFPAAGLLFADSCGLRDQGLPVGPLQTRLCAYPADQSLFTMSRKSSLEVSWPKTHQAIVDFESEPTLCRFERDGVAISTKNWVKGFQSSLQQNLSLGFSGLFSAWQARSESSAMRIAVSLLAGETALTWGWREGDNGIASKPVMRLLAEIDVRNQFQIELTGEIKLSDTRTRVKLKTQGEVPMKHSILREKETPGLIDALLPLNTRWQSKFEIEFEPFGSEVASMWHSVGAVSGTLNGEVGLRPKLTGSGWQWYARMNIAPVSVPVTVHDPLLGKTQQIVQLLPAVALVDWSFG